MKNIKILIWLLGIIIIALTGVKVVDELNKPDEGLLKERRRGVGY